MESETKNYEVAYLLSPRVSEDAVLDHAGKITALIENEKGIIRHVERPKKRRLSYPVKKEAQAYFGWTTCTMPPDAAETLEQKLRKETLILRHLLVAEERPGRAAKLRAIPPRAPAQKILRKEERTDEKLDLETLDKKLEEILGK